MSYSEAFKKQVVQKAVSGNYTITELGQKLRISSESLYRWKKLYKAEVESTIVESDVEELLKDDRLPIEELLRIAEHKALQDQTGSQEIATIMDQLALSRKESSKYTVNEKYAIVITFRTMKKENQGHFLRQRGLTDRHIKEWEDELLIMSTKTPETNDYIKKLEAEVKALKKKLKDTERDKRELEILIELKKKFPTLFPPDEGEK